MLDEHPNIGRQLVRNLAQRVRKLTADVKSLALQDVYGRVANVLMDLSEERGDGTLYIPEKLTQQDIADRVGASREMVARILKDLTIGEYIRFRGPPHHHQYPATCQVLTPGRLASPSSNLIIPAKAGS